VKIPNVELVEHKLLIIMQIGAYKNGAEPPPSPFFPLLISPWALINSWLIPLQWSAPAAAMQGTTNN
jgi:hypothetical protein